MAIHSTATVAIIERTYRAGVKVVYGHGLCETEGVVVVSRTSDIMQAISNGVVDGDLRIRTIGH
ncbi:hypothetical protein RRF57_010743 [Xylaria bambusicola]|uniref:Uncharacterized protein n=1 Tax=Xylaria bambusicola TaxID=326684 RepID=A0AAN7ZCR5_9PEZI